MLVAPMAAAGFGAATIASVEAASWLAPPMGYYAYNRFNRHMHSAKKRVTMRVCLLWFRIRAIAASAIVLGMGLIVRSFVEGIPNLNRLSSLIMAVHMVLRIIWVHVK